MALFRWPSHRSQVMDSVPFPSPTISDDSDISPAAHEAEPVPQSTSTHRLASPVLKYLEARALLLGMEARDASRQVVAVIVWLTLGALAAFVGWLLLASSLVGLLSVHCGWSWVQATAVVGAAHIFFAIAAVLVTWNRLTNANWFSDTLNEFKKDRAWLKTQTTKN